MKKKKWMACLLATTMVYGIGCVNIIQGESSNNNTPELTQPLETQDGEKNIKLNNPNPISSETPQEIKGDVAQKIIDLKKRLDISEAYPNFDYTKSQEGSWNAYNFSWSNDQGELNVTLGEDGNIYAYSKSKPEYIPYVMQNSRKQIYSINKNEAINRGEAFLKKAFPKNYASYKYEENALDGSYGAYTLNFSFWVDFIKSEIQKATVVVDPMTGEIRSFYALRPPEGGYPSKGSAISMEKAKALYQSKLGLKLVYQIDVDYSGAEPVKSAPRIAYVPKYNMQTALDAISGEKISLNSFDMVPLDAPAQNIKSESTPGLTPEEQKKINVMEAYLSAQGALEKVKSSPIPMLPKDLKLNSSYMAKRSLDIEGNYVWNLSLSSISDSNYQLSATVNAKTGEVIDFYRQYNLEQFSQEKSKIKSADVKAAAQAFINIMIPERASDFVLNSELLEESLKQSHTNQGDIMVTFVRKVNDLEVLSNTVTMAYNAATNQITFYSILWYNMEFPKPQKVISEKEAYEKLFKILPMTLYYGNYRSQSTDQVKLIYNIKNTNDPIVIDGVTGNFESRLTTKPILSVYKDIGSSPNKEIYEALSAMNIGLNTEKLEENKSIARKDFLILLLETYNDSNVTKEISDEILVEQLVKRGIIEEGDVLTQGNITFEEAIRYMVNAAGYKKLSSQNGAFNGTYANIKDISPDLKGAVVMARMVGILEKLDPGTVATKDISRGEALVRLYYYLKSK